MKRFLLLGYSALTALLGYSQQWVLDEIADEARESEPLSFWNNLLGLLFIGGIYLIIKIIASIPEYRKQKAEFAKKKAEEQERELKKGELYSCPICGKKEDINKASVRLLCLNGGAHHVRFCKSCSDAYSNYRDAYSKYRKYDQTELPNSWCITIYIIVGLYMLGIIIYEKCTGMEAFFARVFGGAFLLFCAITLIAKVITKLLVPQKPFDLPTSEHVKKCNAIID